MSHDYPASGGTNGTLPFTFSQQGIISLRPRMRFFQQCLPEWLGTALFMAVIINMDDNCVRDFDSELNRRFTDTGRSRAGMKSGILSKSPGSSYNSHTVIVIDNVIPNGIVTLTCLISFDVTDTPSQQVLSGPRNKTHQH